MFSATRYPRGIAVPHSLSSTSPCPLTIAIGTRFPPAPLQSPRGKLLLSKANNPCAAVGADHPWAAHRAGGADCPRAPATRTRGRGGLGLGLGWGRDTLHYYYNFPREYPKPNAVILYGTRARRGSCARGGVSGCCVCRAETERAGSAGVREPRWASWFFACRVCWARAVDPVRVGWAEYSNLSGFHTSGRFSRKKLTFYETTRYSVLRVISGSEAEYLDALSKSHDFGQIS